MSEKSVILHEQITLSQADTVSVVGSARTHFCHFHQPPCAPEESFLWRCSTRVQVEFWNSLFLEIMAKLMKMRGGRHTSRVRMSTLFVVLPRWQSSGLSLRFSFFCDCPRQGLDGKTLSEGVVDTAPPPQCEFSNLQNLPLTSLLEILCWPVIEFY